MIVEFLANRFLKMIISTPGAVMLISQRGLSCRCPLFIYCPLETGSHSVSLAALKLRITCLPCLCLQGVRKHLWVPLHLPNDKCLTSEKGQFWCFILWCHLQIHQSLMTGTGSYAEFIMEETQVVEDTAGIYSVPETHTSTALLPTSRRSLKATSPQPEAPALVPSSLTQ